MKAVAHGRPRRRSSSHFSALSPADHNGKFVPVSNENFKGKWSSKFYPATTFVCPTELGDLADLLRGIPEVGVEAAAGRDRHPLHLQGLRHRYPRHHTARSRAPADRRIDSNWAARARVLIVEEAKTPPGSGTGTSSLDRSRSGKIEDRHRSARHRQRPRRRRTAAPRKAGAGLRRGPPQ